MTQDNKDLLLKDICSRLPYGIKVEYNNYTCEVLSIDRFHEELTIWKCAGTYLDASLEDCKPYLFPLDKISGDMWSEYLATCVGSNAAFPTLKSFEWCNENHVDFRGLILKGLALDATGKNIY